MKLVNLYGHKKDIYLFCRENKELKIYKKQFFHYYYITNPLGEYLTYNNVRVKKILCSDAKDVYRNKSDNSWEADISHTKRYIIDNVDYIEPTEYKYCFLDIEILSDEFPDPREAKYPISCISLYNSYSKEIRTWFLPEWENEYSMLNSFVEYLAKEKFDLILGWNILNFDYPYLYNRIEDFARLISPIKMTRYSSEYLLPAGTSIVDYYILYKKVYRNEQSYTLDNIMRSVLGKGKTYSSVNFNSLDETVKLRNRDDVRALQEIEESTGLLKYYDEIRRLALVEWEDFAYVSRIIDMLILKEAKKKKIVLPSKRSDVEKEDYEGGYREAFKTGLLKNVTKYDVSSAYPSSIVEFCLDKANIVKDVKNYKEKYPLIKINDVYFKQNPNAVLPSIISKLMTIKDEYKKMLEKESLNTKKGKDLKIKYNAIKSIVNSSYGVCGNKYTRMFDIKVASSITYIPREIIKYTKKRLEDNGIKVVYVDTDGIFCEYSKDISSLLNSFVQEYCLKYFNKKNNLIKFNYEDKFVSLFILTKCRYKGRIIKNGAVIEEIKGLEIKRADSSKFMSKFQDQLLNNILDEKPYSYINAWVKEQKELLKKQPLIEIGFPCKINRTNYKYEPVFLRALRYTKEISSSFDKKQGDLFYYIYVKPKEREVEYVEKVFLDGKKMTLREWKKEWAKVYDEPFSKDEVKLKYLYEKLEKSNRIRIKKIEKPGKYKDVIAFDENTTNIVENYEIDWDKMIELTIDNKVEPIFEAMGWEYIK